MDITLFSIIGLVVLVLAALGLLATRYKIAAPTEALIVTSRGKRGEQDSNSSTARDNSGQQVIIGSGKFVIPLVQAYQKISLESQSINVSINQVPSLDGILLDVTGVAIVKVGGTTDFVRMAAQRFGGDQQTIKQTAEESLAGSLRSIVGQMNVSELVGNRAEFTSKVIDDVSTSIENQGLILDTFQLQSIDNRDGYFRNVERVQAAKARENAEVAEEQARLKIESQKAETDQEIAERRRDLELRRNEIRIELDKAAAEAEAAKPLEEATRSKQILREQRNAEQERANLEQERLDVSIRKPAEAARFESNQKADAERYRIEQEAGARLALAEAEAKATLAQGEAEAASIQAKGFAEAEVKTKLAEAFENYGSAAILDRIAGIMPELARASAEPLSNIDKMTVISTDGASQLQKSVANNISGLSELLESTLGVNVSELIGGFSEAKGQKTLAVETAPSETTKTEAK